MAKTSMVAKQQKNKNMQFVNTLVVNVVAVHILYIVNLNYAVFVFRELAYKGQIPGVRKAQLVIKRV